MPPYSAIVVEELIGADRQSWFILDKINDFGDKNYFITNKKRSFLVDKDFISSFGNGKQVF